MPGSMAASAAASTAPSTAASTAHRGKAAVKAKSKPAKDAQKGARKKKPSGKKVASNADEGLLGEDHDAPPLAKNLFDVKATTAKLTKRRPSILEVRKKPKKAPAKHKKPVDAEGGKQPQEASPLASHNSADAPSVKPVKSSGLADGKKAAADKAHDKLPAADSIGHQKSGELRTTSARNTPTHSSGAPESGPSAIAVSNKGTSRLFYIGVAAAVMALVVLAGLLMAMLSKKYSKNAVTASSSEKAEALIASSSLSSSFMD